MGVNGEIVFYVCQLYIMYYIHTKYCIRFYEGTSISFNTYIYIYYLSKLKLKIGIFTKVIKYIRSKSKTEEI